MKPLPIKFRPGDKLTTQQRQRSAAKHQSDARAVVIPVTLPRVGADYAFLDGRLLRDGEPQPMRAR